MNDLIKEKDTGSRWAALCHIAAFVGWMGLPFGNILGPLFVWTIKKNEYSLVEDQGKEALNFQISMTLYLILSIILLILSFGLLIFVILPFLIFWIILKTIFVVIAALKASDGVKYRYPLTIRFIK